MGDSDGNRKKVSVKMACTYDYHDHVFRPQHIRAKQINYNVRCARRRGIDYRRRTPGACEPVLSGPTCVYENRLYCDIPNIIKGTLIRYVYLS